MKIPVRRRIPLKRLRCLTCGKRFRQVRHWQKYCSDDCRYEGWLNARIGEGVRRALGVA